MPAVLLAKYLSSFPPFGDLTHNNGNMIIHILLNIPQSACGNNTHNPKRNTTIIHKWVRLCISLFSGSHNDRPLCQIAIDAWEILNFLDEGLTDQLADMGYGRDIVDSDTDGGGAEVLG